MEDILDACKRRGEQPGPSRATLLDAALEIERLRASLRRIKDRVCGEASPYWDNSIETTCTRNWIANECDISLCVVPNEPAKGRAESASSD